MASATLTRRAIGIVRVSQKKGREGESFVSPEDQRDRVRAACERDGLRLVDVLDELDVSGGSNSARPQGHRRACRSTSSCPSGRRDRRSGQRIASNA
jgi:hypothetical protein